MIKYRWGTERSRYWAEGKRSLNPSKRIPRNLWKSHSAKRWRNSYRNHSLHELRKSFLHDEPYYWKVFSVGNLNKRSYWRKVSLDQGVSQNKCCQQSESNYSGPLCCCSRIRSFWSHIILKGLISLTWSKNCKETGDEPNLLKS